MKKRDYLLDRSKAEAELTRRLTERFSEMYGDDGERKARLDQEIQAVIEGKHALAFLWAADLIALTTRRYSGNVSFARGAAGSCLCSRLLGISHVDPIRLEIPYEFFIKPGAGRLDFAFNVNLELFYGLVQDIRGLVPADVEMGEVPQDYFESIRVEFLLQDRFNPDKDRVRLSCEEEGETLCVQLAAESGEESYPAADSRFSITFFSHDTAAYLARVLEDTKIPLCETPEKDPEVIRRFFEARDYFAIPEFETDFVRGITDLCHPETYQDYVKVLGLAHGSGVYVSNGEELLEGGTPLSDVIGHREDIYRSLLFYGYEKECACRLTMQASTGKGITEEDEKDMLSHGVPGWLAGSIRKIRYAFPAAHSAEYIWAYAQMAYFRIHFPKAFEQAFLPFF